MPSPIPPTDVQRAFDALGVTQQDFETIRRVPFPQAVTLLQELKAKARRTYKRLILELHPDHNQGDTAKTELYMLLGRVLEELDKLKVQPLPPAPPPSVFFYPAASWRVNGGGAWATASTTASTTSTTFTQAQVIRIVRMRPR
jgi:hypothetical protein